MKTPEQSMWLEYESETPPQSIVKGYEDQENECVATLLNGIPDEGGSAPKRTFEMLIRMAFQGGLVAIQSGADKQAKEDKEYIEDLCAQLCKMEDALGFKNDCTDKDGAFVPTIGPWLERVRDLIAAEGELGDVKDRLQAVEAERDSLQVQRDQVLHLLSGGQLTEKEVIESGLGKGVLIEKMHSEYMRTKAENYATRLRRALEKTIWTLDNLCYGSPEAAGCAKIAADKGKEALQPAKEQ